MNKTRLNIIIALMGVAVIGLIVIQSVWIIRMYNAEEQRFSNYVNESLISLTRTLQKREVAKIFLDKINPDSTQIFLWNEKQTPKIKYDRNIDIVVKDNSKKYDVNIDSANVYTYKYEYEKKDTLNEEKLSFIVKVDSLLGNKTTIVKEVFTEFVNIRKSPDEKEIDLKLIDSLLSSELNQRGIDLKYAIEFDNGKLNSENNNSSDKQFSAYLFPNDVVPNNTLINVNFENRAGYFIEAIGLMTVLSILFIVLIIVVFYQTIKMLIKQKKITDIKNDLINNITHEFKTPISTIAIACEALNEPELSDKRSFLEKYTSMIKYENNRLKNLVDNLLNTAVSENDQIKLKKSEVDITELIREVIKSFDEKLGEKNGEIKFDQNEKITVKGDEFHLMNIFSNLIDNAVKYCETNPKIEISVRNNKDSISVIIKDNGIGMSKKNISEIFNPFYRVPTGNIHNVKGYGIGLNYVKKYVEAHNGKVSVESKLGKGSTFEVRLPNGQ